MIEEAGEGHPVIVAIAGPNGAGKTTFFQAHLREAGLRFVNADDIAHELGVPAYDAAGIADALRRELLGQRESFVSKPCSQIPRARRSHFSRRQPKLAIR